MLTPKTISAEPERPISQDFAALRKEALDWLKTWCHESWTDFNESDPGVTLLDELCYALTDLGLRTELPIPRLVNLPDHSHPGSPWPANGLYRPDQVFPMKPLTAEDYRKLILDHYFDVLDARCASMSAADGLGGGAGLYVVSVLLDPDLSSESATGPDSADRRLSRIKQMLDGHRNLGERFEKVEQVPVVRFSLRGRLRLQPWHQASEVLADAYMAVRSALLPSVQHTTCAELEAQGVPASEAYSGPRLVHGAIGPAADLLVLPWTEVEHRTLDALNHVPGMAEVEVEFVRPESGRDDAVRMLASEFVMASDRLDPQRNALTVEAAAAEPDLRDRVENLIRSRVRASGRQLTASLARASGRPHPAESLPGYDVETFEPMGNGLPDIYGIGRGGLTGAAEPLRRARSKQLQGYLLVFEQLAADMATQLAHVRELFSNRPQHATIFSQPLYHVPGVFPLLKDFPAGEGETNASDRHAREVAYQANPANPYEQGLRNLSETAKRFRHRRARFLDHLLARFGESYPLSDPANQETNANKESLLRDMPALGENRASGRARHPGSQPRRSGLEHRIELLLRRDDASTALVAAAMENGEEPVQAPARSGPFYFLLEHLLFLPTSPAAEFTAGATRAFDPAHFRSRLTHVLLNWTVMPLTPALRRFAEDLIRTQAGAHLESRFLWFERAEFAGPVSAAALTHRELAALHEEWVSAGSPAMRLAAPPGANSILVYDEDIATRLFSRIDQPEGPTRIWPEK